jgi:septal ring factor EnvC (AmiA/AmiB activator)
VTAIYPGLADRAERALGATERLIENLAYANARAGLATSPARKADQPERTSAMNTNSTDPTVQAVIEQLRGDIADKQDSITKAEAANNDFRSSIERNRQSIATSHAFIAQYERLIAHLEGREQLAVIEHSEDTAVRQAQQVALLAAADLAARDLPPVYCWDAIQDGSGKVLLKIQLSTMNSDPGAILADVQAWADELAAPVESTPLEDGRRIHHHVATTWQGADVFVWNVAHLPAESEDES